MQRLSEELERQGEAMNHHAALIHQREAELDDALDRANRAQDELIAMEPPTLSQAVGGLEILLRVSTEATPATPAAAAAGAASLTGDDAGENETAISGDGPAPTVWCLVRYAVACKRLRSKSSTGEATVQDGGEEVETEDGAGSSPRGSGPSAEHSGPVEEDMEEEEEEDEDEEGYRTPPVSVAWDGQQ